MEKSTPLVNWLRKEIRRKNSPIVVFCGRPRSGKTAYAMRIGWELHPDKFDYAHVVRTIEEFAEAYKRYNNDVIILDEASQSLYLYDWNSMFQKVFSIINDTQAFRYNLVFIVLPMVHKLGKVHRFDVDAIVTVSRKRVYDEYTQKWSDAVFYKYQIHMKRYNDLTMRPPRVMTIVESCGPVPMPPPHIWDPYINVGQKEFKDKILDEQLAKILPKKKVAPRRVVLRPASSQLQNRVQLAKKIQ